MAQSSTHAKKDSMHKTVCSGLSDPASGVIRQQEAISKSFNLRPNLIKISSPSIIHPMPPLIIGHRGAPEAAIENTEASFRVALAAGVHILETDVRLCADGHLVLWHDANFSRMGGPRKAIRQMKRGEIEKVRLKTGNFPEMPPLFMDQALTLFPQAHFNVDLKDRSSAIVKAWFHLLRHSGAAHRCRTASFHDSVLRRFRRLNPMYPVSVARLGVLLILIKTALGIPHLPKANEGVLHLPEKAGLFRIITGRNIAKWQKLGWQIHVWTVDDPDDIIRLAQWGVDAIITNRPSMAQEILKLR